MNEVFLNRNGDQHAGISIHGTADCGGITASRERHPGRRGLSQAGHCRADLLPVETEVCRDGDRRAPAIAGGRGREPALEATGGRPHLGQTDAAGGTPKKLVKPAQKRAVVQFFRVGYQVSERRACQVVGIARSSYRYRSQAQDQAPLRRRLRELAAVRVRYGYRRLHVLLRREGWPVNHKRVYRLYREEGLMIRTKRRKKRVSLPRVTPAPATRPNERWSMDFLADTTGPWACLQGLYVSG